MKEMTQQGGGGKATVPVYIVVFISQVHSFGICVFFECLFLLCEAIWMNVCVFCVNVCVFCVNVCVFCVNVCVFCVNVCV
jgi:hypothetical protein